MTRPSSDRGCRIRAIEPGDEVALERFYAGLSVDSREGRFLGATHELPHRAAHDLCRVDHAQRQGLVAEVAGADGRAIVAHLCLEPIGDRAAEVAVAVADAWQHHGIGRALLAAATTGARAHRVDRLVASMRWSNAPLLGLIRSMGLPVRFGLEDGGVLDVVVDLTDGLPRAA
jgi:acetyltransferase